MRKDGRSGRGRKGALREWKNKDGGGSRKKCRNPWREGTKDKTGELSERKNQGGR